MILIKNRQRKIVIDVHQLRRFIESVLSILEYSDFDLGLLITTDATIRAYNKKYRAKDSPTDILSFSYHEDASPEKRIKIQSEEDKNLGDLIISAEYIMHNVLFSKSAFNERIQELIVHGICHLLGYDHREDRDYERMRKKEEFILNKIKGI